MLAELQSRQIPSLYGKPEPRLLQPLQTEQLQKVRLPVNTELLTASALLPPTVPCSLTVLLHGTWFTCGLMPSNSRKPMLFAGQLTVGWRALVRTDSWNVCLKRRNPNPRIGIMAWHPRLILFPPVESPPSHSRERTKEKTHPRSHCLLLPYPVSPMLYHAMSTNPVALS